MRKLISTIAKCMFALVLAAFFIFLASGLVKAIAHSGMGSADTAGWIQAIGSIAAIAITIVIATHQQKASLKSVEDITLQQRTGVVGSLVISCTWARDLMSAALDDAETYGAHGTSIFSEERLDHIREVIERSINDAERYGSTIALIFVNSLWEVREFRRMMYRDQNLHEYAAKEIQRRIADAIERLELLQEYQNGLRADCLRRGITLDIGSY